MDYKFTSNHPPWLKDYGIGGIGQYQWQNYQSVPKQEIVTIAGYSIWSNVDERLGDIYLSQPAYQLEYYDLPGDYVTYIPPTKGEQGPPYESQNYPNGIPLLKAKITHTQFWLRTSDVFLPNKATESVTETYIGSDQEQLRRLKGVLSIAKSTSDVVKSRGNVGINLPVIGSLGAELEGEVSKTDTMEQSTEQEQQGTNKWTKYEKISRKVNLTPGVAYCDWALMERVNIQFIMPENVTYLALDPYLVSSEEIHQPIVHDYLCSVGVYIGDYCAKDNLPNIG